MLWLTVISQLGQVQAAGRMQHEGSPSPRPGALLHHTGDGKSALSYSPLTSLCPPRLGCNLCEYSSGDRVPLRALDRPCGMHSVLVWPCGVLFRLCVELYRPCIMQRVCVCLCT